MANVIVVNDLHLSDVAPASCTESYTDDLFDLLEQTVALATEHEALVSWSGDVFHIKTPSRNSHRLVQRTIELAKSYPHGLSVVPGNHDVMNDRLDSIPAQPLGVLFKAGAAEFLQGWSIDSAYPVYGVPWLQRFTDSKVVEALEDYVRYKEDSHCLCVTHAPLYPPGRELKYEFYEAQLWAKAMGSGGSVAYGHVHDPHGVWECEGVRFCNYGSLSRGALTESHLNRPVQVAVWSSVNGEFRPLTLKYKDSSEVFRVEAKKDKERQVKLDDFLASIGHASIQITTSASVLDYIRTLGLSPELETVVQDLLDTVSV